MLSRRHFLVSAAGLSGGALVTSLLAACAPPAPPAAPPAEPKGPEQKPAAPAPAAQASPAAQPKPASDQPRGGGTLRAGYWQEHKTLDPHLSLQVNERWLYYAVYNTLVGTDEKFNSQP